MFRFYQKSYTFGRSLSKSIKMFNSINTLRALSPLDGRYSKQMTEIRDIFSEAGLNRYRTTVEVEWMKYLLNDVLDEKEIQTRYKISTSEAKDISSKLDQIVTNFNDQSAEKVKEIEGTTNHDVKAVEYYIKSQMTTYQVPQSLYELVHFCCTSEDINNLAWGLMIKDSLNYVYHTHLTQVVNHLAELAEKNYNVSMMSRTHGQPATPTTMGKEFANFAYRINEQQYILRGKSVKGKINGAVGNFNAHLVVMPQVNWLEKAPHFIQKLGLEWNPYTTQIENHDSICDIFNSMSLINSIAIGLSRDMWSYISLDYFKQKTKEGEIGSSTMPHKVNPIDFENAEGNLGLSNALLTHMSGKLPISRFQRDLSDSTVLRNVGTAFGYSLLAFNSLEKGLGKLVINNDVIERDLDNHWELLAEPLQTLMRYHGHHNPYEMLKDLTRGKNFTKEAYLAFVEKLELPQEAKSYLKELRPNTYIGNADHMAKNIRDFLK